MTGTHRHLFHPWMSGSEPQTTNLHLMGESMLHVIIKSCVSSGHSGTKSEKELVILFVKIVTQCRHSLSEDDCLKACFVFFRNNCNLKNGSFLPV